VEQPALVIAVRTKEYARRTFVNTNRDNCPEPSSAQRLGNWLTPEQSQRFWQAPNGEHLKEKRDRALLAILLACGVRRHEAVELNFGHIQQREDHWAIVDLNGKAGHIRTIPMPISVKNVLDQWVEAENLTSGRLFCRVHKMGKPWGEQLIEKAIWHVVREYAVKAGVDKLAPMTCAGRVLGSATQPEANWSKIQFLLVHVSIQTTERYLGCKQRIQGAVNDKIGIEPPE
jgi:site-specific recombinase XerD